MTLVIKSFGRTLHSTLGIVLSIDSSSCTPSPTTVFACMAVVVSTASATIVLAVINRYSGRTVTAAVAHSATNGEGVVSIQKMTQTPKLFTIFIVIICNKGGSSSKFSTTHRAIVTSQTVLLSY